MENTKEWKMLRNRFRLYKNVLYKDLQEKVLEMKSNSTVKTILKLFHWLISAQICKHIQEGKWYSYTYTPSNFIDIHVRKGLFFLGIDQNTATKLAVKRYLLQSHELKFWFSKNTVTPFSITKVSYCCSI